MKKKLFIILTLLWAYNAEAARWFNSPEVPNVSCADGIDNDGDGSYDSADADCAVSSPFSANGNGYRANVKDGILSGYTTATDATSVSGTYVKKTSNTAGFYTGELALHANFTNATYYAWIRQRCSETRCYLWMDTSPIRGSFSNSTQAMALTNSATFTWVQVAYTGSNANFYTGSNGGGVRTLALNGNGAVYIKSTDGLEIDCIDLDPDSGHTPDCPAGGGSQPTANYEILELGAETTPTAWNSAAFTNANVMTWNGYDSTSSLTCTVKMLWDNAATDRLYISADCNDTDDEIASVAEDTFSTSEDNVDFRWRLDQSQTLDASMRMVAANLQPVFADGDWSGVDNARTFTPDFNTTVAKTVTASTSWQIFVAIDAGSVTADTLGLCNLAIRDKDASTATTIKHFYGTTSNAMLTASEFGLCKWSSTTVPASGGGPDVTAPTITNVAEGTPTTSAITITYDTDEAGTAFITYGTVSGTLSSTSTTSVCSATCTVALTGLTAGTQYFYRAKVTDAVGNTGQSAEGDFTTAAQTGTHFAGASAAGSANCSNAANQCLLNNVWLASTGAHRNVVAGDIIILADGTYTGASSMLDPPDNLNGTVTNKITVKALNDGGVTINGQAARIPIHLRHNDHFIIEGINAHNSSSSVVLINTGADNNIIRRVVAWDAPSNLNTHVWSITENTGNLLEDVAGFGNGRKTFTNSQGGNNLTIRRAFGVWQASTRTGPKMPFSLVYNSREAIYENIIATWDGTTTQERYGLLSMDGQTNADYCVQSKMLGSIGYLRASQTVPADWTTGSAYIGRTVDCVEFRDVVVYHEPGSFSTFRPYFGQKFDTGVSGGPACTFCQRTITNALELGLGTSSINADVTVTNRADYDTIAAMNTANANPFQTTSGTGARVCFRYENGTLTSTKLWPWPMDSRIGAAWDVRNGAGSALAFFGSLTSPITTIMETMFGTIPAGCKS